MAASPAARIAGIALQSGAVGAAYSLATRGAPWIGGLLGLSMGGWFTFLEIVVFGRWARALLFQAPFAVYFALRVAVYLAFILAFNLAALALLGQPTSLRALDSHDLEFGAIVSVAANVVFSVSEILGPGVMFAVAAGRYRRPRRERRLLLYADLIGSTTLAERLGEERFLDLLNAFFADLSAAIAAEGGEIHKYVGDEVIAVWPDDADPGRPIRAALAAADRLAAKAADYRRAFAVVPAFRAALHAGPVVIGELGAGKKEIALIGDAMNTAARILEAARETKADLLASETLLARLSGPPAGVAVRRLPPLPLRGKAAPLTLFALARA